jgi:hypothetical protein
MDAKNFASIRRKLGKTQKEMGQLIGVSLQAIHSYEQGWRVVPVHAERQILFLLAMKQGMARAKPCWAINECPLEARERCPAREFQAGQFCWFISGTVCAGNVETDWHRKMKRCRSCEAFKTLFDGGQPDV